MDKRYQAWRSEFSDSEVIDVDSEKIDFRKPDAVRDLIDGRLAESYERQAGAQLQFFTSSLSTRADFVPRRHARSHTAGKARSEMRDILPDAEMFISRPIVYIAAPFTAAADGSRVVRRKELFEDQNSYGVIPQGPYRKALSGLADSFSRIGFTALLPHRDVNKWGRRRIAAPTVFSECSYHVSKSALFVGVLGRSHGSHYEFGLARGLGIPCISITCEELDESFVASGVQSERQVLHWRCSRLKDLPNLVSIKEVREFIYSNIGK
jgi:hypothetical protein